MRYFFCSICLILFTSINGSSQNLPEPTVKKVNALFDQWNKTQSPGCVVGIIRNDSVIFSNGYGMANLEYAVVNTPETVYHLASVSKQFTAYSIILLANQKKLDLDDDIRKYLPWFPDLKYKITIRNLLNHTSGIRDQWELLAISGTRLDDVITQEQIVKILSKQRTLNFAPGEKFLYSNSGFTLLAEIVKSVSGKSLRAYTEESIFKPLGMLSTHFHDDYTEIEKNRASSYNRKGETQFSNSILSYSNAGATSLFSNVNDLGKWIGNFYNTRVGNQELIAELTKKAKLNDGKELDYAAGIASSSYKGWKQYTHDGADAGFRTSLAIYPELKMGIIVLCNLGDMNPHERLDQIANLLMTDKTPPVKAFEVKKEVKIPADEISFIKKHLGDYFSNEMATGISFSLKNDSLHTQFGPADYLMTRESKNVYSLFYAPNYKFTFSDKPGKQDVILNNPDPYLLTRQPDKKPTNDKALAAYTGSYYCPELDCTYGIELKNHHLYLTNNKYNDTELTTYGTDHLITDLWFMKHMLVNRNKTGYITGFEVTGSRIIGLKFIKVNK